jgi:large subunit ribosomal protein L25
LAVIGGQSPPAGTADLRPASDIFGNSVETRRESEDIDVSEYQLDIELRTDKGKGVARKLRATGRIPGVFYAPSEEATPITLDPNALDRVIKKSAAGMNTLIDVKGGDKLDGKVVLVKDIQRDPLRGVPLHADLYAIDVNKVIHVSVPIRLTGTSTGVKLDGGILDQTLREIELNCLPHAIPEEIAVDVTPLAVGDSLHVRDLALPDGVELLTDDDLSIANVALPKQVEEEAPVVEGEGEEEAGEAATDAAAAAPAEGDDKKGD